MFNINSYCRVRDMYGETTSLWRDTNVWQRRGLRALSSFIYFRHISTQAKGNMLDIEQQETELGNLKFPACITGFTKSDFHRLECWICWDNVMPLCVKLCLCNTYFPLPYIVSFLPTSYTFMHGVFRTWYTENNFSLKLTIKAYEEVQWSLIIQ